jgi:formylglycine-generating enzyme required for sulfatase activity
MKLTGQKVQQICDALLDAYPTRDLLRMMVRVELDQNLEEIAGGENQSVAIFNLVSWAERNGQIDELIAGALKRTPGNEALKQLAAERRNQMPAGAESRTVSPLAGAAVHSGPASIDVFLSYSRRDGGAMHVVQEALREAGLSVWTDEGLEPGTQSWQDAISEAVRQADAMVVLLSPDSSQSKWVKNEIGFAQVLNKRVLPLLIAGEAATAVPIGLISAQWVDGRQNLNQAVVQGLLPSLRRQRLLPETPQAPPLAAQGQAAANSSASPASAAQKGEIRNGTCGGKMVLWLLGAVLAGAVGLLALERLLSSMPPATLAPLAMRPGPTQAAATQTSAPTTPTIVEAAMVVTATQAEAKTELPTAPPTKIPTLAPTPTQLPAPTATWTRTPAPTVTPTQELTPTPTWTPIPAAGSTRMNAKDGAEYVYVPAGPFTMGSTDAQISENYELCRQASNNQCDRRWWEREGPQGSISLDSFWIMRTEVTNREYKLCVEERGCTKPNNARWNDPTYGEYPVTDVTWHQANDYAAWAGGRLPTEAEWEKACRGTEGRIYPWGDSAPTADLANYGKNVGDTSQVGKYSPQGDSPYGLADMAGNVQEWTSSQSTAYPYDAADGRENAGGDAARTLRGGGWSYNGSGVRCATRYNYPPSYWYPYLGFRVVMP